jgi:hypothetical protein
VTLTVLKKFINHIYVPDFCYKFLLTNKYGMDSLKKFTIHFKYTFNSFSSYSPLAIKMIYTLESIYPKRPIGTSKVIRLSYGRKRIHSSIILELNGYEFFSLLPYLNKDIKFPRKQLTSEKHICAPTFPAPLKFRTPQNVILQYVFSKNQGIFNAHNFAFFH